MRISVVGTSASGKTTAARRFARALDVEFVELDALHWGPDWSAATSDEMTERVTAAIAGDAWVVDGNYWSKVGTLVWERADEVVWIDPPRWRVMVQAVQRALVRAVTREELWHGNRQSLAGLMFWRGDESIVRWAWNTYPGNKRRYEAAMCDPAFERLVFHRLQTRRQVDDFIHTLSRRAV